MPGFDEKNSDNNNNINNSNNSSNEKQKKMANRTPASAISPIDLIEQKLLQGISKVTDDGGFAIQTKMEMLQKNITFFEGLLSNSKNSSTMDE
jgi:hypothetical protein